MKFEQNLLVLGVHGAEEDAVGAIGGSQSLTPPPLIKAKGQDTKEAIPGQLILGRWSPAPSPSFVTEFGQVDSKLKVASLFLFLKIKEKCND